MQVDKAEQFHYRLLNCDKHAVQRERETRRSMQERLEVSALAWNVIELGCVICLHLFVKKHGNNNMGCKRPSKGR
jgi:hypothetical protein